MTIRTYTEAQLCDRQRLSFCGGLCAGGAVVVAAFAVSGALDARAPATVTLGAPHVVREDAAATVTTIPVRIGERAVTCQITIDRRHRAWSMAC